MQVTTKNEPPSIKAVLSLFYDRNVINTQMVTAQPDYRGQWSGCAVGWVLRLILASVRLRCANRTYAG